HPSRVLSPIRIDDVPWGTGVLVNGGKNVFSPATTPASMTMAPAIYTPPAGKSARLLDMSDDGSMIAIAEFDTNGSPSTAATHYLLIHTGGERYSAANWQKRLVGAAGAPFWASSMYVHGMV